MQHPALDTLILEAFPDLEPDLPRPRLAPGGFFEFEAADVDSAVALASRLKASGRYRYFRGQRDAAWRVRSSFARLDPDARAAAVSALGAFEAWVRRSPELVPYLKTDDQIIASAQHHGICATTFMDLTTDPVVAGWFAADGASPGDVGAIYLLDPEKLEPIFEAFSTGGAVFRFLTVDVPNLWRLQAQSGLFLECNADLDRLWPLDRIVFPQNGAAGGLDRGQVYPEHRSHLEQMIDQHRLLKGREDAMRALLAGGRIHAIEIEDAPEEALAELPRTELPGTWAEGPDERWEVVDLARPPEPWTSAELCSGGGRLADTVAERRSAVRLCEVVDADPAVAARLQGLVDRLWEGMRPHPYDAPAITRAVSALARLEVEFRGYDLGAGLGTLPVARRILADPVEIEFGIPGDGVSRACVSGARLRTALCEDARRRFALTDEVGGNAVLDRLQPYGGRTLRCFDRDRLLDLFIDEIIPWQVVSKRDPIAFSSLHITSLGRP